MQDHGTRGGPVTLRVEDRHAPLLREYFVTARVGRIADLAEYPDQLRDPERTRAEAETYGRLIEGVDRRTIVADEEVRAALVESAAASDEANEYARVLREHAAFEHLLRQLPGGSDA